MLDVTFNLGFYEGHELELHLLADSLEDGTHCNYDSFDEILLRAVHVNKHILQVCICILLDVRLRVSAVVCNQVQVEVWSILFSAALVEVCKLFFD